MISPLSFLLWVGALLTITFLVCKRFPEQCKKLIRARNAPATLPSKNADAPKAPHSAPLGSALFDAFTNPSTWMWWAVVLGVAWLLGPKVASTPTVLWIPIALWLATVFFSRAKSASLAAAPGPEKDKKAHPALRAIVKHLERLAILSTIAVAVYFGFFAPAGSWEKAVGKRVWSNVVAGPSDMAYPLGLPRNPNFAANKLDGWMAIYIAANQHYKVPQSRFHGERLPLLANPARHITELVDLTISFGANNEALDIRLTGACSARDDRRRWVVSKTCGGEWIDRWRHISGKFYLEVKEGGGGQRYIDVYLYDGNNIPRKNEITMFLTGAPSPHILLQLRPKEWRAEHQ